MKKLFLLLLTLASTNVLFGVRPQQQRPQPRIQDFIVQRADQTAQNNANQVNATRPLNRRTTTDLRMTQFLNDFQITRIPNTLPAPQNNNNTFLNRPAVAMPFDDSQSDDDLLSSNSDDEDDDISSISDRTENRENNNRYLRAPTPEPMGRFMNDFQLQGQRTNAPLQTQTLGTQTDGLNQLLQARTANDVRRFLRARTAAIFAQIRRNHNQ